MYIQNALIIKLSNNLIVLIRYLRFPIVFQDGNVDELMYDNEKLKEYNTLF